MLDAASRSMVSKPRGSLGITNSPMDFATLGRAPLRMGFNPRRITSADLQIVEATSELLTAEVPEPAGPAVEVSLLRGFKATIPSSEKSKYRRRRMRNVEVPRLGLKKLGMNARGLLIEEEDEDETESVGSMGSDDDFQVITHRDKGKEKALLKPRRRGRESLGAGKSFGKDELTRQIREINRDKENIHVRRTLMNNEIVEITNKIHALDVIRAKLEEDLLKLQEDELELDDELEGVRERMDIEEAKRPSAKLHTATQSSRRRKGPAFLPSEHDELPPGVAFMTLSSHNAPISALDFSEPYGTLVTAALDDAPPRVWDLLSGTEIGELRSRPSLHGEGGGYGGGGGTTVRALQVEDHVCLTGGEDGCVRLWDLRRVGEDEKDDVTDDGLGTLSEAAEEDDAGARETDEAVLSRPNGIRGGQSEGAEDACVKALEGHTKAVTALYFEDNCLVTGASDKTLRQWDLTTGQCVMTMDILWAIAHPTPALTSSFSTASLSASSSAYHRLPGNTPFAVPTPAYADGSWDMYTDFVGGVQFWGYALVSGSGDGAVRMWDMRTGQAHRTLLGHTAPVTCLQFDELHVVSGGLDKAIRIWDLRTGGVFETIKYDHGVTALQFDSRKIVAAAGENGVKIYNRTTMQHSTLSINGHIKPAERLRYMDRYLVSGARDSTVKIWAL
ncbi:WD40 repeat-like protein [Rickenella mellea]|uniref:WD40 repeat-like protein n=1 Tax=Rickenella mellea TaxID=50990 RepID=A0A4Y7Q439_9AGAM|nr:WD40 repeat-like protein [Rickenella mellea]